MAIAYGMTAEQFLDGEPWLFNVYAKVARDREEAESKKMDYSAWLVGLYCYQAFGVVLSNSFSKHGSKAKYPEQPISQKKTGVENDLMAQYQGFMSLVQQMNRSKNDKAV